MCVGVHVCIWTGRYSARIEAGKEREAHSATVRGKKEREGERRKRRKKRKGHVLQEGETNEQTIF